MQTVSIAKARARLADLIRRAEAGQVVCITRWGRPVAVLVSSAASSPWPMPANDWVDFCKSWRRTMQKEGLEFLSDPMLSHLRVGAKPLLRTKPGASGSPGL